MGLFHFDFVSGSAVWDAMAHQRWPGQEDGGGLLIHHPPSFDPRAGWASTRGGGRSFAGERAKNRTLPNPHFRASALKSVQDDDDDDIGGKVCILQVAHTREPSVLSMGGQTHRKAFVERFELGLSSYGRLSSSSICRCLTTVTTVKGLDHLVRPERKVFFETTSQKPAVTINSEHCWCNANKSRPKWGLNMARNCLVCYLATIKPKYSCNWSQLKAMMILMVVE